jgi:hypothetical protein
MRKSLSLVLVIFLSLSFLATPGFSYSDCGKNCCCSSNMTPMQHTTNHQAQFKGNCCPEAAALPCGLKKSQDLEFPMCALSVCRAGTNNPAGIVVNLCDPFYANNINKHKIIRLLVDTSLQSSPIYLQHLSLLI